MVGFPYNVLTAVALMLCQCPRGEAASGAGRPSLSGGQRVAENERNATLNPPPPSLPEHDDLVYNSVERLIGVAVMLTFVMIINLFSMRGGCGITLEFAYDAVDLIYL